MTFEMAASLYLGTGVIVYVGPRAVYKRLRVDPKAHRVIWLAPIFTIESLVVGILFWPMLALVSLLWLAAELFHAQGKKEIAKAEALEASRDKKYDGLDLMKQIDLLEAEAKKVHGKRT